MKPPTPKNRPALDPTRWAFRCNYRVLAFFVFQRFHSVRKHPRKEKDLVNWQFELMPV